MTLRQTIEWIALNDECDITDIEDLQGLISVCLAAEMLNRPTYDIAYRVSFFRREGIHVASTRKLGVSTKTDRP